MPSSPARLLSISTLGRCRKLFTKAFWVTLGKRALVSMAATAAGLVPAAAAILDGSVDWKLIGLSVVLSGVAVVLAGIVASQVGDPETPNFDRKPVE